MVGADREVFELCKGHNSVTKNILPEFHEHLLIRGTVYLNIVVMYTVPGIAAGAGMSPPASEGLHYNPKMKASTRRFLARPSSVSLLATGFASP